MDFVLRQVVQDIFDTREVALRVCYNFKIGTRRAVSAF